MYSSLGGVHQQHRHAYVGLNKKGMPAPNRLSCLVVVVIISIVSSITLVNLSMMFPRHQVHQMRACVVVVNGQVRITISSSFTATSSLLSRPAPRHSILMSKIPFPLGSSMPGEFVVALLIQAEFVFTLLLLIQTECIVLLTRELSRWICRHPQLSVAPAILG